LEKLLCIPSPTGQEGEIQQFLADVFTRLGLKVHLEEVFPGRPNLYAHRGKSRYLIATHSDTVPLWEHAVGFGLRVIEGRAYGRGVVDAKGQIASLIRALESTDAPAAICIFVDEEKDAKGSESFRNIWGWPLEGALVLEPTEFKICISQLGSLEFEATVPGQEAHGATYREDKNAILRCTQLFQELRALPFLRRSYPYFDRLGITIGKIQGGIDNQLIPSSCQFAADIPIPWGIDRERIRRQLLRILKRYKAAVKILNFDPPLQVDPEAPIVQTLRQAAHQVLGSPPPLSGMTAWTDAENLFRKGLTPVVFGAGCLTVSHTTQEWVSTRDLLILTNILREFLERADRN